MSTTSKVWLSVNEAASRAGISRASIYRYWDAGTGPRYTTTPGGSRRVLPDWVDEWLFENEAAA